MRIILSTLLVAGTLVACTDVPDVTQPDFAPVEESLQKAEFGPAASATYQVTIKSLITENTLQPLTPPLVAVHRKPVSMFTVGAPASFGLEQIAENGNLGPMYMRLDGSQHVTDLQIVPPPDPVDPLLPGESETFTVRSERGAKYLSFVAMLICTNDGFTGVDGLRLPMELNEPVMVYTDAYDAGTEPNTEAAVDLVGACPAASGENLGPVEDGVVRPHPGIDGAAALDPETYGWDDPVAMVTVTRIQ